MIIAKYTSRCFQILLVFCLLDAVKSQAENEGPIDNCTSITVSSFAKTVSYELRSEALASVLKTQEASGRPKGRISLGNYTKETADGPTWIFNVTISPSSLIVAVNATAHFGPVTTINIPNVIGVKVRIPSLNRSCGCDYYYPVVPSSGDGETWTGWALERFRRPEFSSIGDSITIVVTIEFTYESSAYDEGNGNECSTKKFSFDAPDNNALAALPSDGDQQNTTHRFSFTWTLVNATSHLESKSNKSWHIGTIKIQQGPLDIDMGTFMEIRSSSQAITLWFRGHLFTTEPWKTPVKMRNMRVVFDEANSVNGRGSLYTRNNGTTLYGFASANVTDEYLSHWRQNNLTIRTEFDLVSTTI